LELTLGLWLLSIGLLDALLTSARPPTPRRALGAFSLSRVRRRP
jgi:hypothetical protein